MITTFWLSNENIYEVLLVTHFTDFQLLELVYGQITEDNYDNKNCFDQLTVINLLNMKIKVQKI